jgi:hypothetical protein
MNCELMLTYDTPAYMFNVYKNQLSRQTGSRNPTDSKTFPTIWHTYMKLVTKYQISAINSCREKCNEKYLGWTDRGKTEKWFYIWYMALAWWFVPCLPFPGLSHIYFLFTVRLRIFHVCIYVYCEFKKIYL